MRPSKISLKSNKMKINFSSVMHTSYIELHVYFGENPIKIGLRQYQIYQWAYRQPTMYVFPWDRNCQVHNGVDAIDILTLILHYKWCQRSPGVPSNLIYMSHDLDHLYTYYNNFNISQGPRQEKKGPVIVVTHITCYKYVVIKFDVFNFQARADVY